MYRSSITWYAARAAFRAVRSAAFRTERRQSFSRRFFKTFFAISRGKTSAGWTALWEYNVKQKVEYAVILHYEKRAAKPPAQKQPLILSESGCGHSQRLGLVGTLPSRHWVQVDPSHMSVSREAFILRFAKL